MEVEYFKIHFWEIFFFKLILKMSSIPSSSAISHISLFPTLCTFSQINTQILNPHKNANIFENSDKIQTYQVSGNDFQRMTLHAENRFKIKSQLIRYLNITSALTRWMAWTSDFFSPFSKVPPLCTIHIHSSPLELDPFSVSHGYPFQLPKYHTDINTDLTVQTRGWHFVDDFLLG